MHLHDTFKIQVYDGETNERKQQHNIMFLVDLYENGQFFTQVK